MQENENRMLPEEDTDERREMEETSAVPPKRSAQTKPDPILTLEVGGEVDTEENIADIVWHEIHNAYRTRRILSGKFGGIEMTDGGKNIGVVEYKGYRIAIPVKEMVMELPTNLHGEDYRVAMQRQNRILSNMLGAEIDFIVRGIDAESRSVVASRREAMLKKRQIFYMDTDEDGEHRVRAGRIAQARIIGVHEKVLRLELFGVETTITARDLSWEWIGDVHDHYSVGDTLLVRITDVECPDVQKITVRAEVKSLADTARDKLKLCRPQSKYAGKVIDVRKGVVFIRLTNGVNAVAHSCYDRRMPGKKDDVSFVVTHIDDNRGVAVGIITRIIKQNL